VLDWGRYSDIDAGIHAKSFCMKGVRRSGSSSVSRKI
jgi:hypothetical protein